MHASTIAFEMKPAFHLMFDLRSGEARIGCILAELFEEREARRRELHECFCDRSELRDVFTGKRVSARAVRVVAELVRLSPPSRIDQQEPAS